MVGGFIAVFARRAFFDANRYFEPACSKTSSTQWPNISAASLAEAAAESARPTNKDDFRHAACGALCMSSLADVAKSRDDLPLRQAVSDMPTALGEPDQLMRTLRRLIDAHDLEWRAFVSAQGDRSYLYSVIGRTS